jgi:hypothetical protein
MYTPVRSVEARDKLLKDITGGDFSSKKYRDKWKARLDEALEHKQKPI